MNCIFCFSCHKAGRELENDSVKELIRLLPGHFDRVNYVGGEPCVDQNLYSYLSMSKELGLKTSIVSNGTIALLDSELRRQILGSLDILGISVDSTDPAILRAIGRRIGKQHIPIESVKECFREADELNVFTKVNTVVTSLNKHDLLIDFIEEVRPDRWKIFQMLPIEDENFSKRDPLQISLTDFNRFIGNNSCSVNPVVERNEDMLESYVMISPDGRFYDNSGKKHHYSDPILEVGIEEALSQIKFRKEKFEERKGSYIFQKTGAFK